MSDDIFSLIDSLVIESNVKVANEYQLLSPRSRALHDTNKPASVEPVDVSLLGLDLKKVEGIFLITLCLTL
jgi:hypothetical protein